jgi:hypothetical protein
VCRDAGGNDVIARVAVAAAPRPDLDEPLHCPALLQQQQRRSRCRTTKPRAQRSRSAALCFVQDQNVRWLAHPMSMFACFITIRTRHLVSVGIRNASVIGSFM